MSKFAELCAWAREHDWRLIVDVGRTSCEVTLKWGVRYGDHALQEHFKAFTVDEAIDMALRRTVVSEGER